MSLSILLSVSNVSENLGCLTKFFTAIGVLKGKGDGSTEPEKGEARGHLNSETHHECHRKTFCIPKIF